MKALYRKLKPALIALVLVTVFVLLFFVYKNMNEKSDYAYSGELSVVNGQVLVTLQNGGTFFVAGNVDQERLKAEVTNALANHKKIHFFANGGFRERPNANEHSTTRYFITESYETKID